MTPQSRSQGIFKSVLAAAALGVLTAVGSAQTSAPLEVLIDQPVLEAVPGNAVTLTIRGEPGHYIVLVIGARRGQSPLGDVGMMEIGTDPQPSLFCLGTLPPSGEMSMTCDFSCQDPLTNAGPLYFQAVSVDMEVRDWDRISNLGVFQLVSGDCGMCVDEAPVDSQAKYGGGHALWLPGIAKDFVFTSGGDLAERSDGTARLVGVVSSQSDSTKSFAVDILFSGRMDPGSPSYPPTGSPKKELESGAYYANGGPVDPTNWHYYTGMDGVLMGLECLEGAIVSITRRGPAFQFGRGANGKNVGHGSSGWLDWLVLEQSVDCILQESGQGDINVNMGPDCEECVEEASDHAITMKAFGDDFLFVSGGEFEELQNGTARIAGVLQNDVDPLNRWQVEIIFSDKMMPGSASYPPTGSPKRELPSSSYMENGGPVDTNAWYYYLALDGTLVGLDGNDGMDLEFDRRGPAFQVGLGANGKNLQYGASGWLDILLLQDDSESNGDINIDIGVCE